MGLSAWNAYRARQAELAKTLSSQQIVEEPKQEEKEEKQSEQISTSPALSGVEVEIKKEVLEDEVKPKPKKKRTK